MGSYYDIDAILTDAHKIPCTFELDIPGLGYLDENPGGDVWLSLARYRIKAQTPISLPLWLSTLLAVQRLGPASQPLCTLDLPSSLAPRVLNALRADPKTVDLRSLAAHYYDLAARVLELFEEENIVDILTETYKKRAAEIADHAHNLRGAQSEGADFLRGLDLMEEHLFRAAHDSSKALRLWIGEIQRKA